MKYIFYISWSYFNTIDGTWNDYGISVHSNLKNANESKIRREKERNLEYKLAFDPAGYQCFKAGKIKRIKVEKEKYDLLKNKYCMELIFYNCLDIKTVVERLNDLNNKYQVGAMIDK